MKSTTRHLFTFFLFFLVASGFLLVANSPVRASSPSPSNDSHLYAQQVLLDLSSALTCQLTGIDPSGPDPQTGQPKKCLGYDLNGKLGFLPNLASNGAGQVGGAVGLMGNLISVLYTPPASTGDYFQYLANNFGIVRPAYAQGIGFNGLAPLLPAWTIFRNMAYLFFVIIFIVTGLTIMLRIKIDPRTVMSIQNQIPKLIITLILITFSYAIAGFLIDIMYLVIYLLTNIAAQAQPAIAYNLGQITQATNPFDLANRLGGAQDQIGGYLNLVGSPAGSVGEFFKPLGEHPIGRVFFGALFGGIGSMLGSSIAKVISELATFLVGFGGNVILTPIFDLFMGGSAKMAGSIVGIIVGGTIGTTLAPFIAQFVGMLLAFLIIFIAITWALFRLWFELLKAYIFILVDILFAPLWLLTGVIPGGMGVGPWLRDLASNLSAFPTTIGMFLIGRIFMETIGKGGPDTFVPPLVGSPDPARSPQMLGSFIGLGIILLTPDVVNMVKKVFKAPVFPLAPIFKALGVGTGVPTRTVGTAAGAAQAAIFDIYGKAGGTPEGRLGRVLQRLIR